MRVLVTGGAGFIGSNYIHYLLKEYDDIEIVNFEDTYEKAFQIMAKLGTHSIPVVKDKKLLGLLEFSKAFKLRKGGA